MNTDVEQRPSPVLVSCRIAGTHQRRPIEFECVPDIEGAQRWLNRFRRVHRVDLHRRDGNWQCIVSATGHRLPVERSLPLPVGLGMATLGTPTIVHPEPVT